MIIKNYKGLYIRYLNKKDSHKTKYNIYQTINY